jgi:DNA invertase Pin-like site-specific DNA recombinase
MTTNDANAARPSHKVLPTHHAKLAVVYVRQSTPQQVIGHRESADLQYQLRRRAVELGWAEPRVLVIDDDQGKSGQTAEDRLGFQRLLAEISLGHVGIVFGREMSRLARSCKDWYQLLELCGLFNVLLADADGVYDPTEFNDRLLLGLKGTMSEAELHVLKTRMHQGKLNKARRGELFTCVPVGYVRAPEGGIALDPDEQVRAVIRLVFAKFAELGSVSKVHAYLVANDVRVGMRTYKGPDRGRLVWQRARRRTIYEVLRRPIYSGAYVHGRTACVRGAGAGGRVTSGRRIVPSGEWAILLRDRVPAYITWDEYQANLTRLRENALYRGNNRPSGRVPTLLNGIVRCGRCGHPMAVRNARARAFARYVCDATKHEFGDPRCQGVVAVAVDRVIEGLVLRAVEPAALELSLRAAEQVERDRERLHQQWEQRAERIGYEVARAKRQYDAVDPENRLVARELERQWEARLGEQREVEEGHTRFCREQPRHLSVADRERIRALATDVPALWHATTTTGSDRRRVVRQLIERVEVVRHGAGAEIDLVVHWRGGTATRHVAHQGTRCYDQLADHEQLRERVRVLRGEGRTADQIAEVLNAEGHRPARGGSFTAHRVRHVVVTWGLTDAPPGAGASGLPGSAEWWLPELARELDVPPLVVHQWRWAGWVRARQLPGVNGRVIVWADRGEMTRLRRLRAHQRKHGGRSIPAALTTPKAEPSTNSERGPNRNNARAE